MATGGAGAAAYTPCAGCKYLRRKCTTDCIFGPYFPANQPQRFIYVHKVFGASNVAKILSEVAPNQREDAVNSLFYEAEARVRDPIYGCVGLISVLQNRLKQVQLQVVNAKKELSTYIGPQAMLPILDPNSPLLAQQFQQHIYQQHQMFEAQRLAAKDQPDNINSGSVTVAGFNQPPPPPQADEIFESVPADAVTVTGFDQLGSGSGSGGGGSNNVNGMSTSLALGADNPHQTNYNYHHDHPQQHPLYHHHDHKAPLFMPTPTFQPRQHDQASLHQHHGTTSIFIPSQQRQHDVPLHHHNHAHHHQRQHYETTSTSQQRHHEAPLHHHDDAAFFLHTQPSRQRHLEPPSHHNHHDDDHQEQLHHAASLLRPTQPTQQQHHAAPLHHHQEQHHEVPIFLRTQPSPLQTQTLLPESDSEKAIKK